MSKTPPAPHADEPDSLDHLLRSLSQYDTLFGEDLRAAALTRAWQELADTDPRVINHMSLRLAYLQAKATAECLSDLATANEIALKQLESQQRTEKLMRHLVRLADEGVGELEGLRHAWNGTEAAEPEADDGGNVSELDDVDAGGSDE